jgi:hypothetical protein
MSEIKGPYYVLNKGGVYEIKRESEWHNTRMTLDKYLKENPSGISIVCIVSPSTYITLCADPSSLGIEKSGTYDNIEFQIVLDSSIKSILGDTYDGHILDDSEIITILTELKNSENILFASLYHEQVVTNPDGSLGVPTYEDVWNTDQIIPEVPADPETTPP